MKKIKQASIITFLLTVLLSVNIYAGDDDTELKAKFQKMSDKMIKVMLSGDTEASMAYYHKDIISMPSYSPMLEGIDAVKASNKASEEAGMKMNSMKLTVHKAKACGDMVTVIGTYDLNMSVPGMPDPMDDKGKYLEIWVKDGDKYKIMVETWNTDMNPMQE